MKMTLARRVVPVLAVALGAAACNENLTDINTNPNQPTSAPAPYLLTNAQVGAVGTVLGTNFHMTLTALWAQHYSKIQYIDEDRYDLRPATVDALWSGFYTGPLRDFAEVTRQGLEQNRPNFAAIGEINSVWTWHVMTDVWGDIPYSEALKGAVVDGNIVTATYDTQQAIYTDLLARLAAAQGQLTTAPSGGDFGTADVIYGSDVDGWRRFANSMRLRLAMRMSDRAPAAAQTAFLAAAALPLIVENDQNADLEYGEESASANPIYKNRYEGGRLDHAVSLNMTSQLDSLNDPRLGIYADPAGMYADSIDALAPGAPIPDRYYRGFVNGSDAAAAQVPSVSLIGEYFYAPDAPAVLFAASETFFLLAEARQRGWAVPTVAGMSTADQFYRHGIRLSMEQYGISSAEIDAYLAQPSVALGADPLKQIRLQKWIALYGNGPEAYSEWRRSATAADPNGTPDIVAGPGNVNTGRVPVRVFYPTIEQSLNNTNLQTAISRQGGLTLNEKVWWDL